MAWYAIWNTAEMSDCDATTVARNATTNIGQNTPGPPGSDFQNVPSCGCGSTLSGTLIRYAPAPGRRQPLKHQDDNDDNDVDGTEQAKEKVPEGLAHSHSLKRVTAQYKATEVGTHATLKVAQPGVVADMLICNPCRTFLIGCPDKSRNGKELRKLVELYHNTVARCGKE